MNKNIVKFVSALFLGSLMATACGRPSSDNDSDKDKDKAKDNKSQAEAPKADS